MESEAESWDGNPETHASDGPRFGELNELIAAAAAVKAGIVGRDQFEKGERRKLNLGHTFAHAIEHISRDGEPVSHGEAVAMGIVLAAKLSEKIGMCAEGLADRVRNDFVNCGLQTSCPYTIARMAEAMGMDKKAEDGRVRFVLLRGIGDVDTCTLDVADVVKIMEK